MLRQVLKMEESMVAKTGLKAMWPVAQAALNTMTSEDTELEEAASIIGHCKTSTMFDNKNTKLTFFMSQIVDCGGKITTLGSVVSRLLRSMGFERKTGVAPPGFLERKLKETPPFMKAQLDMRPADWGLLDTRPRRSRYAHHGRGCHSMRTKNHYRLFVPCVGCCS